MRNSIIIFSFILSLSGFSQNWNVFNKGYRYNYKFNNSQLVSNVLFADTIKQTGADTTYIMNNIGVVNGGTLTINKPQFLMKKIVKQANGIVKLQDTSNITIIPTCTLNQTWLFDAAYSQTATCVATSTITLFSVVDSVKTIVVNSTDTVKLSKQFGIIQFPKLYAQNKYYRLVGIEKANTYDSLPFFGERVPNAWDFYKLNVNTQICYTNNFIGSPNPQGCEKATLVIKTRSVTPTGYSYNVDKNFFFSNSYNGCGYPNAVYTLTNINMSYGGLNSATLTENYAYPGKVIVNQNSNIIKFGLDNSGRFYKYMGKTCSVLGATNQNQSEVNGYEGLSSVTLTLSSYNSQALTFGVGAGKVAQTDYFFEHQSDYCTTCYGTVGITENTVSHNASLIYPNPANTKLNISAEGVLKVRMYNSLGKLVAEKIIDGKSPIDISEFPAGIYFIELENNSLKASQKLIIEH